MINSRKSHMFLAFCFVLTLGSTNPVLAEETERESVPRKPTAARGFYLQVGLASAEVDGDFDGQAFVAGGGSLEILPEIGSGSGYKLAFGLQGGSFDFDMNWTESNSDGTWLDESFDTRFVALNFDGRYYWLRRVRPFALLGIGFNQLTVDNGSMDGVSAEDAKYKSAISIRGGGGVQYVIRPKWALNLEAVYRKMEFSNVDGIVSGSLEGSEVDGSGITYSASIRYVFGR